MKKVRYIYAGFDSETPLILSSDPEFELVASALNPIFLVKTLNPFNLPSKAVYFLRRKESLRWLELFLCYIWKISNTFSSSSFKSNKYLLSFLSENKIKILDFNNVKLIKDYIEREGVDLIVVNAWEIIPDEIIKAPKYGAINVHPSKLPKYRGALPTLWALKNGDRETAVTYMILGNSIDRGNILAQHVLPIEPDDTAIELEYKIRGVLRDTLAKDIKKCIRGEIVPHAQKENESSKTGKYFEYMQIKWDFEKGKDIYNKVLLYPFIEPGLYCYFIFKNKKIFIRNAKFLNGEKISGNTKTGEFKIKGLSLLFRAIDGIIKVRLFKDLSIGNSLYLVANYNK
jgi:methionyl-tRNA formyltransferase